jgi:hypothetical protein
VRRAYEWGLNTPQNSIDGLINRGNSCLFADLPLRNGGALRAICTPLLAFISATAHDSATTVTASTAYGIHPSVTTTSSPTPAFRCGSAQPWSAVSVQIF